MNIIIYYCSIIFICYYRWPISAKWISVVEIQQWSRSLWMLKFMFNFTRVLSIFVVFFYISSNFKITWNSHMILFMSPKIYWNMDLGFSSINILNWSITMIKVGFFWDHFENSLHCVAWWLQCSLTKAILMFFLICDTF